MEELRHQQASWEPVERPVALGDLVVIDINGTIDGKPLIDRRDVQYRVSDKQSFPAPGFAEQLVGMNRGEEKGFPLRFPQDYPHQEVAGQEATFRVKLSEIKQESLPQLDDEFARGVDPKFNTLDKLKQQIASDIRFQAERKTRLDFEDRVVQAVVDQAQVEFPPVLVKMEVDSLLEQQVKHQRESDGRLSDYLASINKTEEEAREELRPAAIKRVTAALVLDEVTREEKLEISPAEIDSEIEDMVKGVAEGDRDKFRDFLNTPQSRESIEELLLRRKTIQHLVEIAKETKEIAKETETAKKEVPE